MPLQSQTILLVNDEASDRDAMRATLAAAGYAVLEAADYAAAEALHRRLAGAISLLVVDVSLPGGNGYELAKALQAGDPNLKVLFISGHAGSEVLRFYGLTAGDDRFLEKPFGSQQLLTRIRRALASEEPPDLMAAAP
jgi:two-component system, cell cycle sensor histidine kinase and response regulator CckA